MKKRILALLAASCMAAGLLAACGGSTTTATTTAASSGETTAASGEETTTAAQSVEGTVSDTGVFQAVCPDGWLYVEQSDYTQDADDDGNYPVDTSTLCFCKGATSALDVLSNPSVYAYLKDGSIDDLSLDFEKEFYDETEDFDCTINGNECVAYTATYSLTDDSEPYHYQVIYMPLDDSHYVQFNIVASLPDSTETISYEDADVQTIMSSVKVD